MIRKYKDYLILLNDLEYLYLATIRMLGSAAGPTEENLMYLKEHYTCILERIYGLGERRAAKMLYRLAKQPGCTEKDVQRLARMVKRSAKRLQKLWGPAGRRKFDTLVIVPQT